ncbi:hypothetical protein [Enterococcus rivorum]|uniref:Uncharacterized protein n=1 Tax=Enterococcus rivorum TaxID=762845 RepID=A0A1E5KT74_9ENTE|nr:hypothetical protein [Enterococcus rivorum]MBP2098124.1 hypothetical protein [Enterococcus rivorum]OEH81061.1 hypothetical protein BCR26_06005 [Enterococcus rivorum]
MTNDLNAMIELIKKFQNNAITLQEAIELRRLSAEFSNICGEFVEEQFTQAYLFTDQAVNQ